jgi:NADH-dependent peroxiredoxin subunit F
MKIDPVCKMSVEEENAITANHNSEIYFFCSEGCKKKFESDKLHEKSFDRFDLIIIGGGPAGLTAAVYAALLKMKAFLIADGLGGQAIDSTKIENYMGFDFITGPELVKKFHYQLINSHYLDHLISEVELIEASEGGFIITTSEMKKYFAKAILVSAGMKKRKLSLPGEKKFQRKGVFYGNLQDLSFVQDGDAVVIGGGNSALQIVENLHTLTRMIYLVSDTELTADALLIERIKRFKNLKLFEDHKAVKFSGSNVLSSVTIRKNGKKELIDLPVSGVFVSIGLSPNSSLVNQLVDLNERGEIIINQDCSTSYPGIYAAGDVTNAFGKRIIIAAGEGAKAAMAARQYILNVKKKAANENSLDNTLEKTKEYGFNH